MKLYELDLKQFSNKNILITGGAGFIGSSLAMYLQNHVPNINIIIFDKFNNNEILSNGNYKYLGDFRNLLNFKGKIIQGDITNKSDIEKLNSYKFDIIYHFAAISDTTEYNQSLMLNNNVNSFYNIIELNKKNKSKLIYASSASVYGNNDVQKIGVENPSNIYGFSKLSMDNITNDCIQNNNSNIIGLRFFNVYGTKEEYKYKTSSIIYQFRKKLINNEEIKLFYDSENIYRDFVYIDDVIQACILSYIHIDVTGIFNVGSGVATSFLVLTKNLMNSMNVSKKIKYIKNPYINHGYQMYTKADISLTIEKLNYKPNYILNEEINL